jgi:hemoglobin
MGTASLFERLGGTAGIRRLVDDIVVLHMQNPIIRQRFLPYLETPERLDLIKQHTCAFLEAGSGGPAQYTGRSMRETHRGMNITDAEYAAAVDDILGALRNHGIDAATQDEVRNIALALKGDIIEATVST